MITDKGKEYEFRIEPRFGVVYAEIFYYTEILGKKTEIYLIGNKFGKFWRKPIEEDYEKARKWVDNEMLQIWKANKN